VSAVVICWSCEKSVGEEASRAGFCAGCGAVLPPGGDADHFQVLGVQRRYGVDLGDLERRYKDAAKRLHPDRFARADVRARRASMARTVQLNDAWKTLRDPVRRAEYLLRLAGIEVGGEEGTMKRQKAAGAPGGEGDEQGPERSAEQDTQAEKLPVPQELLMEVMDLREALLDARAEGDLERVRVLTDDVRARRGRAMDAVAASFEADPQDIDRATAELVAVRYFDRFLSEVAAGAAPAGTGATTGATAGVKAGHAG
jgi:molecular chaperone HscB